MEQILQQVITEAALSLKKGFIRCQHSLALKESLSGRKMFTPHYSFGQAVHLSSAAPILNVGI